jgi:hypothetical protein
VAHASNPSFSGGRDQERIMFQIQPGQIVRETLSQKKISQNRAGGMAQGVDPHFKPQYQKNPKQNKKPNTLNPVNCEVEKERLLFVFILWVEKLSLKEVK